MPDNNMTPMMSPKATFIIGLLGGVAVISTIGFFILLPKVLGNGGSESTGVKNTAVTAPQPTAAQPTTAQPTGTLPPVDDTDYIRGPENAKVTLVEYSDFECPYCLRHKPTIDQVLTEYQGQVRLVYRHFPLSFHPQAQKAAEASECAGEQGKFWEMHDLIFQANEQGNMSVDTWKQLAKDLKLNTSTFNNCLDTGKYASKISQDLNEGAAAGVQGTPATFVNGRLVSGAVPYEQFKQIIDSLL